jgi:hypothetical protein
MWGIVEQVIDNKIYVVFEDRSRKSYINNKNLNIKENNQVLIINNEIVEIKGYNKHLYQKIKELEESIKKNNN